MGERAIRVVIVHPSRLLREGLAFVLTRQQALSVVACVGQIGGVIADLEKLRADVYVIDLCGAGREGLGHARELRRHLPECQILMTGLSLLESDVLACVEAGAGGCLPDEASLEDLVENIRAVASGEAICSRKVAGLLFSRVAQAARERNQPWVERPRVTPREREIIALIDARLSNKEIAVRLRIEVQTVKNHVHNILEKLQIEGRQELRRYVKGAKGTGDYIGLSTSTLGA